MGTVVLIGYMGSGKTHLSGLLGKLNGKEVLDSDKELEKRFGCSISEVFAQKGEAYFREQETKFLEELCEAKSFDGILSTGGGMPVAVQNRALLKQIGTVIYLRTEAKTIAKRLEGDTSRPLLAGCQTMEEKTAKIGEMLSRREAAYLDAADIILDTDGKEPEALAKEILKYLQKIPE